MTEITAATEQFFKLDEASPDSVSRKFDIFSVPFTHTHTTGGVWQQVSATRMSPDGPLEFNIPTSGGLYTDLSDSYVEVQCKVKLANGDPLDAVAANVNVVPGDNFFHSLFSSASVKFNNSVVEYEGNYPWRAYLENLLHTSADHKEELMMASDGWFSDNSVAKDFNGLAGDDIASRKDTVLGSKTMSFSGKLALNVMKGMEGKNLIPGVEINIVLNRAPANIALLAALAAPDGGARIEITKAMMYVRRVAAHPSISIEHRKNLIGKPASYGFVRTKTSFKSIAQGVTSIDFYVQENGNIPSRLYLGLLHHQAQSGHFTRNAFRADHFDLSSVNVRVSGFPNTEKLEMDYTGGDVARAFQALRRNVGGAGEEVLNGLTLAQYKAGGVSWYCFDLSGDRCVGGDGGIHLLKYGAVSVDLQFANPTPNPISAFIMTERDDLITISHDLSVRSRTGII